MTDAQRERLRRLRDGDAMADGDGRLYEEDRRAVAAALDVEVDVARGVIHTKALDRLVSKLGPKHIKDDNGMCLTCEGSLRAWLQS